jgi:pyruvate/2-oxoglutarate/acetoin dehydrogenase E1 component
MPARRRLIDDLNSALHELLKDDERLYVLGEDIADPYGGAFKATRGLSTSYPGQVFSTPISEQAVMGIANGLALSGNRVVVELMFSDFVTLAFDQIVNFASKAVDMYGQRIPVSVVIRCPSGGYRGYGPTHSQSLQKHFLGVPNVDVFEMTPYHPVLPLFAHMLEQRRPCLFFEEKTLYPAWVEDGLTSGHMTIEHVGARPGTAQLRFGLPSETDCVLVAPGGMAAMAVRAAEQLLLRYERMVTVVVPARLYPLDIEPIAVAAQRCGTVCVVEQSTAGATWGAMAAEQLYQRLWGTLRRPIALLSSAASSIPAASHLEREVLVQESSIVRTLKELTDE